MPIKKSSKVKKSKGLPPKKSVKRKPAIVGSGKIKMLMTEGSSMPVAYRVDSLGRKTLVPSYLAGPFEMYVRRQIANVH